MAEATQLLANRFLDATTRKLGVDEEEVFEVIRTARSHEDTFFVGAFDQAVRSLSGSDVSSILRSELKGSALARAEDLLLNGQESGRPTRGDYFIEGASSFFDLSSTRSKIVTSGFTAAFGLTAFAPRLTWFVTDLMAVPALVVGGFKLLSAAGQFLTANSELDEKLAIRSLGEGVAILTLAIPSLLFRFRGLRYVAQEVPKFAKTSAISLGKAARKKVGEACYHLRSLPIKKREFAENLEKIKGVDSLIARSSQGLIEQRIAVEKWTRWVNGGKGNQALSSRIYGRSLATLEDRLDTTAGHYISRAILHRDPVRKHSDLKAHLDFLDEKIELRKLIARLENKIPSRDLRFRDALRDSADKRASLAKRLERVGDHSGAIAAYRHAIERAEERLQITSRDVATVERLDAGGSRMIEVPLQDAVEDWKRELTRLLVSGYT